MKKLIFFALVLVAGCTKEAQVKPKEPVKLMETECKRCVCNPAYCPVGTAD